MARGEYCGGRPVAPVLWGAGASAAAGVGLGRRGHHDRLGCPAVTVAGPRHHGGRHHLGVVCRQHVVRRSGHRLLFHRRPLAVPALLVPGSRGAVLPGLAGDDDRHGLARADRATPQRGRWRVLEAAVPRGPCRGRGGVIRGVAGDDPLLAAGGVLLHAHPRLAVGFRWIGCSYGGRLAPRRLSVGWGWH